VCDVQATHVDRPAAWSVVKCVRSLAKQGPVTSQRSIFFSSSLKHLVLNDYDADASRADILLSACINDVVFGPVDLLAAEVAAHVADNQLLLGNDVEWEVSELEALDGLIVAKVEIGSIWLDVPLFGRLDEGVLILDVVCNLVRVAVLLRFFDGAFGPSAGGKVVGRWLGGIPEQVLADRTELL
jgi:hypothetical protein